MKNLILILTLILSGCVLKQESKIQNIVLKSDENLSLSYKKSDKILKIKKASLPLYLNSRFISYQKNGFYDKYAYYLWGDLPSNLYVNLLFSKLEKSEIFKAVISQESALQSDFVLESRIDCFEQILNEKENLVKISLSVNFINSYRNQIIAHKNFTIKENIKDKNDTFRAFDRALNKIANEIILWLSLNL